MPTLYVENVPEDIYKAVKARARQNRRSLSAEVIMLLKEHVPTAAELRRRKDFWKVAQQIRSLGSPLPGPFPTTEEMIREDRER